QNDANNDQHLDDAEDEVDDLLAAVDARSRNGIDRGLFRCHMLPHSPSFQAQCSMMQHNMTSKRRNASSTVASTANDADAPARRHATSLGGQSLTKASPVPSHL